MKSRVPERLESGRVKTGLWASSPEHGFNGVFLVQGPCGCKLDIGAETGIESGWEHVSVSTDRHRSPNWQEMCFVKDLFWGEEECVIQYHPPASQYVKNDRYRLHMWKPCRFSVPTPPASLIGYVGLGPHEWITFINGETQKFVERVLAERQEACDGLA